MDEAQHAQNCLEEIENALDDIHTSVIKLSTVLEAYPDTDFTSAYEAPGCNMPQEEARELLYTHLAVDTLFLSQSLNEYYEKLDSFERWYQSNAEEMHHQEKEIISGWQREMDKRMQEIRPEITDLDEELSSFGFEIYTAEPSVTPVNSRMVSD